jgi:type IX secretion system PorP/SprF family membrane protein
MKRILIVLLFTGVGLGTVSGQQIPQFSQYMFNGLYVNPAYAGYKEDLYAHLMYRNQWMGITGSPQTVMLGVDGDLGRGSNLGLVYANDVIGATNTNSIMLSYAFRFQVSESGRLSLGLSGGAIHYGLSKNPSKIDISDPVVMSADNVWRPQVDIGFYFDTPHFYAGLSATSLIPNRAEALKMQIMRTHPTCFLSVGGLVPLDDLFSLAPSTLLKTDFKSPLCIDLNAMVVFAETFWLGLSYRTGLNVTYNYRTKTDSEALRQTNALAVLAEVYLLENLRIGVAYDFDLNGLTTGYNGGLEVSLGYYIMKSTRRYATPRYF